MTYSYDPGKIGKRGADRMRFELGDTETEGGALTCALSDEEYAAVLDGLGPGKMDWRMAKLRAAEAIMLKLSFMADTKIDVLSYGLGERAERWRKVCEALRAEIGANAGPPSMDEGAEAKPPYFYTGMDENPGTLLNSSFAFRRI